MPVFLRRLIVSRRSSELVASLCTLTLDAEHSTCQLIVDEVCVNRLKWNHRYLPTRESSSLQERGDRKGGCSLEAPFNLCNSTVFSLHYCRTCSDLLLVGGGFRA